MTVAELGRPYIIFSEPELEGVLRSSRPILGAIVRSPLAGWRLVRGPAGGSRSYGTGVRARDDLSAARVVADMDDLLDQLGPMGGSPRGRPRRRWPRPAAAAAARAAARARRPARRRGGGDFAAVAAVWDADDGARPPRPPPPRRSLGARRGAARWRVLRWAGAALVGRPCCARTLPQRAGAASARGAGPFGLGGAEEAAAALARRRRRRATRRRRGRAAACRGVGRVGGGGGDERSTTTTTTTTTTRSRGAAEQRRRRALLSDVGAVAPRSRPRTASRPAARTRTPPPRARASAPRVGGDAAGAAGEGPRRRAGPTRSSARPGSERRCPLLPDGGADARRRGPRARTRTTPRAPPRSTTAAATRGRQSAATSEGRRAA